MEFKFSISSTIKDDVIDVSLMSSVLNPDSPSISVPSSGATSSSRSLITSASSVATSSASSVATSSSRSKAVVVKTAQQSDADDESKFIDLLYEYLKIAEGFVEIPYPDEKGISVGVGLLVFSNFYKKYKKENKINTPIHILKKDDAYKKACRDQGVKSFIEKYRSYYTETEINRMRQENLIHKEYYNRIAKSVVLKKFLRETTIYFKDFYLLPISTKILLFDQGYAAGTGYLNWNKPSGANKTIATSVQDIIEIIREQGNTEETRKLKAAYNQLIFNWTKYKIFWKYFHLGGRRQQTIWHLLHFNHLNNLSPHQIHDQFQITVWKRSNFDKYVEAYEYVIQNRLLTLNYFNYHGLKNGDYAKVKEQAENHAKINSSRRGIIRPDLSSVVKILPS